MSCGGAAAAARAGQVDLSRQAVIRGLVLRGDAPEPGAYVRLLDATGEFTAEAPTGAAGDFTFYARAGRWTVRALAPGATAQAEVTAAVGTVSEVELSLSA